MSAFCPLNIVLAIIVLLTSQVLQSVDAQLVTHVPIRYRVDHKQQECIYDHFQPNDQVTFSVFLADALRSRPALTISYEGPVAGNEEHTDEWVDPKNPTAGALGRMLHQSVSKHWPTIKDADKLQRNPELRLGVLNHQFKVDWTHAGESEDAEAARQSIQQQNQANHRKFADEWKEKQELEKEGKIDMKKVMPNMPIHTVAMAAIEVFDQTTPIHAEGWYRLCVRGMDSTPILVELDMRSRNNFKGIDPDTGHVYTFAKRRMLDEAELLENESSFEEGSEDSNTYPSDEEEKAKIIENQIRENDLKESKDYLKQLMELTSVMSQQQQAHMARIRSHGGSARRNHESLVWSSKVETLLYAVIMGWNVYSLRRWLLGNSLLGK